MRDQVGVNVGDVFEAKAQNDTIVLKRKSGVDRALAEGLADVRAGRVSGPFARVDEMLASLKGRKHGNKPRPK